MQKTITKKPELLLSAKSAKSIATKYSTSKEELKDTLVAVSGCEYFVMSESKETALESLKNDLSKNAHEEEEKHSYNKNVYQLWESASVSNLPEEYSIDEYEDNVVIKTYNG